MEEFKSKIGRITVQSFPFCEGCPDFDPHVDKNILTGDGGVCYRDENGRFVITGFHIACKHIFRCSCMYRDLKERMLKGEFDGTAQTQPDGDCREERRAATKEPGDV